MKRPAAEMDNMDAEDAPGIVVAGAPTYWLGAKIMASASKNGWRIWLDPSQPAKEKNIAWGKGSKEAWKEVIAYVRENNS
eukprot:6865191-Karenia_brevis.AAC.1